MDDLELQSKIIKMHCKTIQEQSQRIELLKSKLELCKAQRNAFISNYFLEWHWGQAALNKQIQDEIKSKDKEIEDLK